MSNRVAILKTEPGAYKAMMVLENYTKASTLPVLMKELIKIRASQINGCAYCIDMHTTDALKLGETERRIFAIPVWRESHLFSDDERLVLALTEEITLIGAQGLSDEIYAKTVERFGEKEYAQLIMLIVVINAWNRIMVASKTIYRP